LIPLGYHQITKAKEEWLSMLNKQENTKAKEAWLSIFKERESELNALKAHANRAEKLVENSVNKEGAKEPLKVEHIPPIIAENKPISELITPVQNSIRTETLYASFWLRFSAYLIDFLLVGVVYYFFSMISGGITNAKILWVVPVWLYCALMESSVKQATLGKMAVGIIVTDLDGQKITFGKATGRYFGKFISGILLCAGYIMVAFSSKKQGLHDMMAGCLVVKHDTKASSNVPS
jgi:uncharacterized RDD family membrane protein YckC